MVWLYVQDEGELKKGCAPLCLLCGSSPTWNQTPMCKGCSEAGCGRTCAPSTDQHSVAASASSRLDSHANPSRRHREGGRSLQTCGQKCTESSGKCRLRGCSAKTSNEHQSNGRPKPSVRMVSPPPSSSSAPPKWVPQCDDRGGGYLPTLTTRANQNSPSMMKWPAYRRLHKLTNGQMAPVEFWEWMFGLNIGCTGSESLGTVSFPLRPGDPSFTLQKD